MTEAFLKLLWFSEKKLFYKLSPNFKEKMLGKRAQNGNRIKASCFFYSWKKNIYKHVKKINLILTNNLAQLEEITNRDIWKRKKLI